MSLETLKCKAAFLEEEKVLNNVALSEEKTLIWVPQVKEERNRII